MLIFDSRIIQRNGLKIWNKLRKRHDRQLEVELEGNPRSIESELNQAAVRIDVDEQQQQGVKNRNVPVLSPESETPAPVEMPSASPPSQEIRLAYSIRTGLCIFAFFLATFIPVMVVRGVIPDLPPLFRFFANIYLAGTIIFGRTPRRQHLTNLLGGGYNAAQNKDLIRIVRS
jgi:hypothetical protein